MAQQRAPKQEGVESHEIESRRYVLCLERDANSRFLQCSVRSSSLYSRKLVNLVCTVGILLLTRWYVLEEYDLFGAVQTSVVMLLVAGICCIAFRDPTIDSITVLRNYGIQISSTRGFFLLPVSWNSWLLKKDTFIPRDMIVDVVINEGFNRNFEVIFYLCVVTKNKGELALIFSSNRIKLNDQKMLYNLIRETLFDQADNVVSLGQYLKGIAKS